MGNSEYFTDKVCVVTGGNSGIGYSLCEELLKRGSIVYMVGRNHEKVEKAAEKLYKYGDKLTTVIVDVTEQLQVEKAIKGISSEECRLDFLFNNAGISFSKPFEMFSLDDWKNFINTNLWGVIYGVIAAVPIMLKQGFGHIINTSSQDGLIPTPFQVPYATTKWGIVGLTESLRYEYAEKGLQFSTICPGNVATPLFKKMGIKIPEDAYPVHETTKEILKGVEEHKGIIIIPEEPFKEIWHDYILRKPEAEEKRLKLAHDRRIMLEKNK